MDRPEDLQMYDTSDTAGRIIQAAEKLFSEQGFKETTMRQITGLAEVNLAAVNYHFGSKFGLIRSVAERSLSPLCEQVDKGLVQLNVADATPGLDQLLQLMAQALVHVHGQNQNALSVLMRLLDQAYLPSQHDLQAFLRERYGARFDRYLQYFRADAAPLDEREFFWRLHFLLGSVIFTLSNMHTLSALEQQGEATEVKLEQILARMIPVISAGMKAPVRNGTH
ncbi:MAG: TetR/AcrR family transcriptional regulator [Marinobacterium sp.]|jgi:AcrR family transcriptional regulator|uniref:DNA-binding transcriptional regulator, AcrR family n=1 Tax=Marinobacterium iners DSM 11526 TaxID=1122198 RepID=A0A1H4B9H1_9GAMM|nr:TetR/AcrR family transcriptional regulator [Marinobacterium iners]SEA44608.1 DNA-binding transcriptional regulator, AcrR family [Marinobacterium iners DSM 11526]